MLLLPRPAPLTRSGHRTVPRHERPEPRPARPLSRRPGPSSGQALRPGSPGGQGQGRASSRRARRARPGRQQGRPGAGPPEPGRAGAGASRGQRRSTAAAQRRGREPAAPGGPHGPGRARPAAAPARPGAARAGGAYPACCCCCWRRPARARSRSPRSRRWGWESPLCAEREQRRRRCAGPSPAGQDTRPRRPSAPGWGRETPPRRGPAPAAPLRRGGGGAACRGGTGHPRAVLRLRSCSLGPGGIARSPSGDPAPRSAPPAPQPAAPGHLLSCLTSFRGPAVGPSSFIVFLIFALGLGLLLRGQPLAAPGKLLPAPSGPQGTTPQPRALLDTQGISLFLPPSVSPSFSFFSWPLLFMPAHGF